MEKKLFPYSKSIFPWLLSLLVFALLLGLNYYEGHRPEQTPEIGFYDLATVEVRIYGSDESHNVHGIFNNIIEGKREFVQAVKGKRSDIYLLSFRLNSPRPAQIYIDEHEEEVFLIPDSTLFVAVYLNPVTFQIDSLNFKGSRASICEYYRERSTQFEGLGLRSYRRLVNATDLNVYSRMLDSVAVEEVKFLESQMETRKLPGWFREFELNEIRYHKAYLKLSQAYKREVPEDYFDEVSLNNPEAVFSNYYYLYLKTYISRYRDTLSPPPADDEKASRKYTLYQLQLADTLLSDEVHDVFLTRIIFNQIRLDRKGFAKEILKQHRKNFTKKKYHRFLAAQINGGIET